MFGKPKPPIEEEDRLWLDEATLWLIGQFGIERVRGGGVVTPTPEFFPDHYDASHEAVETLVGRVAGYMNIDRGRFDLEIFSDNDSWIGQALPFYSHSFDGAAGLYVHPEDGERCVLALEEGQLEDALKVVATTAHELGHIHLLGDKRLSQDDESHEPMTDLLTVFMGLGIFSANACFQFHQFEDGQMQGWSASRSGYLPEACFGYALALYSQLRRESNPDWATFLNRGVGPYFKKSMKYLSRCPPRIIQEFP